MNYGLTLVAALERGLQSPGTDIAARTFMKLALYAGNSNSNRTAQGGEQFPDRIPLKYVQKCPSGRTSCINIDG